MSHEGEPPLAAWTGGGIATAAAAAAARLRNHKDGKHEGYPVAGCELCENATEKQAAQRQQEAARRWDHKDGKHERSPVAGCELCEKAAAKRAAQRRRHAAKQAAQRKQQAAQRKQYAAAVADIRRLEHRTGKHNNGIAAGCELCDRERNGSP